MPAPKTSIPILSPQYGNLRTLANWAGRQPHGKTIVGKEFSDAPVNKLGLKKRPRMGGLSHLLSKWAPRHKAQRDLAQLDHKHAAIAGLRSVYREDGLLKVDPEAHDVWTALEAALDDDKTKTITTGHIKSTLDLLAKRQEARERDIAVQQFGSTQKHWLALKKDQTDPDLLLRQFTGEPSFPSQPLSGGKPQDLSSLTAEVQSCAAYFRSEADKLRTEPASAFKRPRSIEDYSTQRLLLARGSDPDTQRLAPDEASPLVPSGHDGQLVRGAAAAYRITPPVADWLNELQRQYDALASLLRNEEKLPPDQLALLCGPACHNYVALYAKTVEQLQALSLHLGIPARFADIAMGHRFIVRGYAWTLHHAAGCLLDPTGPHSGMFKLAQGVERLNYSGLVDALDSLHRPERAPAQNPPIATNGGTPLKPEDFTVSSYGFPPSTATSSTSHPVRQHRKPHEHRLTAPSSLGNARQTVHMAIERSDASDEEAHMLLTPLGGLTSESLKAFNDIFSPDAAPLDSDSTPTAHTEPDPASTPRSPWRPDPHVNDELDQYLDLLNQERVVQSPVPSSLAASSTPEPGTLSAFLDDIRLTVSPIDAESPAPSTLLSPRRPEPVRAHQTTLSKKDTPFEEVDRLLKAQTPNLLYGDKDFFEFDANVPSSQPATPAVPNPDARPRRRLLSSPADMGRPTEQQEVKPQEGRQPSRTKRVLKRLTGLSAKG